jgi:hypothetical protein
MKSQKGASGPGWRGASTTRSQPLAHAPSDAGTLRTSGPSRRQQRTFCPTVYRSRVQEEVKKVPATKEGKSG